MTQLWIGVAGNTLYSLAPNVWVVLVSRCVCGMGSTVGLSAQMFVIRTTSETERSAAFTQLSGLMVLGMLAGPALQLPLSLLPRMEVMSWFVVSHLRCVHTHTHTHTHTR